MKQLLFTATTAWQQQNDNSLIISNNFSWIAGTPASLSGSPVFEYNKIAHQVTYLMLFLSTVNKITEVVVK
jgi:hypothetical protein